MTSQGTSEFQEIHLDWQYPDPRSPQSGYKRLFNVQGHQNFERAMYPGAYQLRFNLQKFTKHIQFYQKYFRCIWFFDFVQFPSSWLKMTVNPEESREPLPSLIALPDYSSFFFSSGLPTPSSPLECASAQNKVLPEESQDLLPGVLLGCGVALRLAAPEHGEEEAAAPGHIAQRPVVWL